MYKTVYVTVKGTISTLAIGTLRQILLAKCEWNWWEYLYDVGLIVGWLYYCIDERTDSSFTKGILFWSACWLLIALKLITILNRS